MIEEHDESDESWGSRIDRRTLLRATAVAGGTGLLSRTTAGAGEQPLRTAVHTSPVRLNNRTLVVYRRPTADRRMLCNTRVSWHHRVVAVAQSGDGEPTYLDLYAPDRFPAGTVLELVDRLSACLPGEATLIYVRRVGSPGERQHVGE